LSHETGIDRSTIWPYEDGELGRVYYSRDGHPTGIAAEEALGELEGGRALLFSSGMAATTTAILTLAGPGKTVALASGAYYGTGGLFSGLERWGLQVVEFDQTGPPPEGADLIWIEGPSNPFLTFPDLEAAAAHPAPVVMDATAATPVLLRALDHGADVVMHSATKYLAGHHDALLGALVCRDEALFDELRRTRTRTGPIASPDSAWLLLRSLKTLELRVHRQSESASRSLAGSRCTRRWTPFATRASAPIRSPLGTCRAASAACCRSTSPTRTRPGGSRRRRS